MMEEKILNFIADYLDVEKGSLLGSQSFVDDLGVDSLEIVELCVELENEMGMTIEEEALRSIKTIDDLLAVLKEK